MDRLLRLVLLLREGSDLTVGGIASRSWGV